MQRQKSNLVGTALSAASLLMAGSAPAHEAPPRGPDIEPQAAMCAIGKFPRVGKAGRYNVLCGTLTDAEKCLAIVKYQMSEEGVVEPSPYVQDRAEYCVETFRRELLAPIEE